MVSHRPRSLVLVFLTRTRPQCDGYVWYSHPARSYKQTKHTALCRNKPAPQQQKSNEGTQPRRGKRRKEGRKEQMQRSHSKPFEATTSRHAYIHHPNSNPSIQRAKEPNEVTDSRRRNKGTTKERRNEGTKEQRKDGSHRPTDRQSKVSTVHHPPPTAN